MKFLKVYILAIITLTTATKLAFSQTINPIQYADSTKTITVKIKDISCSIDVKIISVNVGNLDDVSNLSSTNSFK